MLRTFLTGAAAAALLTMTACESSSSTTQPAATSQPSMGMLNSTCPMSGEPVDPNAETASYHGHTIGFCCNACVAGWGKQSEQEKQAFVTKHTN